MRVGRDVLLKRFEQPDEVREFQKGRFELVTIGGVTIGRATYQPGWRWSEDVGRAMGEPFCTVEHVGLVVSGCATAAMDGGEVVELRAGDIFYVPPHPHDSWVVGTSPMCRCTFLAPTITLPDRNDRFETSAAESRWTRMKPIYLPLSALLVVGAMAACEKRDPVADEANAIPAAPETDSAGTIAGGPPAPAAGGAAGPIPAAIQGRWGLTPADCISTRGDAKGLLEIGPDSLKFYESRAVPGTSIETEQEAISGNFNFTGEGQEWSKYVSLKLKGKVLNRSERNPVASYDYARC